MAKDIYHETVKMALIKDGWTITNDPLSLAVGGRMVYVDLGAEKLLAAEKDNQRIAVEIKSFVRPSPVQDLENALGQYVLYRGLMQESPLHQDRKLYLAVSDLVYFDFFEEKIAQIAIRTNQVKVLTFDETSQEISQWIE
ncbi:element excision factor XisH family protein [Roseofilum sp. BLCC_M154]|uniref:Element excision factor XisH family protein n=1 Tax=Roseofilum acuticapitatum BLCC-M154 TaxID=3022444 RepID=A0ABT7AVB7_9CYAN|nr:element excision factor XisH family protein [Roseofilum acuticapitatum]MDJ1170853.1 element excision factor XisH family protein [Roseofilum acuticapitatum BLCC-M154]